jgi:hypothetical protein
LFAWRSGAREDFEVKDKSVAFAAFGGERFALVLEFEFLSRIIASMQSMTGCRHKRRPFRIRSNPDGQQDVARYENPSSPRAAII